MQPLFFVRHPAAFCAYELRITDDITEFSQFFGYIFRLPFAKLFCFFCHFFPSSVFWGFRTPGAYGLFEDSIFF